MKRDMNNKERRKVVVRGKKKTYTRTMLVKTAQDIGRRESLHQIKLEQANHQPSTMSKLLAKAKSGLKGVLPNRNVGALHATNPWIEKTASRGVWNALWTTKSRNALDRFAAKADHFQKKAHELQEQALRAREEHGYVLDLVKTMEHPTPEEHPLVRDAAHYANDMERQHAHAVQMGAKYATAAGAVNRSLYYRTRG